MEFCFCCVDYGLSVGVFLCLFFNFFECFGVIGEFFCMGELRFDGF